MLVLLKKARTASAVPHSVALSVPTSCFGPLDVSSEEAASQLLRLLRCDLYVNAGEPLLNP